MILMSSFSRQWNGILPSGFTFEHFVNAFSGPAWDAILSSLVVGFSASLFALFCGLWAALALRRHSGKIQKWLSIAFYLPSYSFCFYWAWDPCGIQPRLFTDERHFWIVFSAHFVLISAFTFSNVSTGLTRISPDIENVAFSLGASPWYRLCHVTLPLLMPWMISALALSLSLSLGELGATMMLYPRLGDITCFHFQFNR